MGWPINDAARQLGVDEGAWRAWGNGATAPKKRRHCYWMLFRPYGPDMIGKSERATEPAPIDRRRSRTSGIARGRELHDFEYATRNQYPDERPCQHIARIVQAQDDAR